MTFLSHIPLWVFPLFLGLVALGVLSSRDRVTPVAVFYGLPFLGLLSVRATASLNAGMMAWGVFVLAYASGVVFGARAQSRFVIAREGARVRLRGEWLTMVMVMGIFALNFIKGTMQAVAPHLAAAPTYALLFALIAGLIAGLFLGRSMATVRLRP
ncbi:hypothetical protein [Celeribacter marinus]|uniref:hypothetical protein n=1 Tax=Celeribacter marinus TaxID=1397108 RepID=UPI003F6D6330